MTSIGMIVSALLTPNEKCCLENIATRIITINIACVARLYKSENQQWVRISSGVVTLEDNAALRVVSIGFYDLNKCKKLFKTDLYKEMEYRECGPQFHSFNGVAGPLGLAFACPKEAHDLFASVQAKLNSSPSKTGKFANLVHKAREADVKFAMKDFQHIKHVGIDSDGKDLEVKAQNKELARELLEALGVASLSENEIKAVCSMIDRCGATEVQEALEMHSYQELAEPSQPIPVSTPPFAPPPPPPPPKQLVNADHSNLLDSIVGFDASNLKQVKKADKVESLPTKGSDNVHAIETALAQMLKNRRMYLNEYDSDEYS
ncbi:unnamed protein product [Hydatigera taeniaeformis]|uniref:WH1 domain-containing protein n=1 Tax=Hydatigena taeniaeformis TaxID=6205 RepID=A0A0R3WKV1_HYDTA|nr:unnamed protein product [Hydatigera taeniaeformis]